MSSSDHDAATILSKFTSTVFPCDTTPDARYIRCDFKRCSQHVLNNKYVKLPVDYWILNTEKNVTYLEKHVTNEIYNFVSSLEDDEHELNGADSCPSGKDRYELNTRFLENSSDLKGYEKLLVVFNLRDPQSSFGKWIDLFLSAVKSEDNIEINYLCITLSFSSRKELLKQISKLHSVTSKRNLEVMVVLSCHSSTQGQVFSCTPISISKFYNFEEFCSVHDFVCACQEVLKSKLKWIHISSCYAMKLNTSHRDWPVDYTWYKTDLKCILSGSAKEVYETGSQTADLFLMLNTILLPNNVRTQFHSIFRDASLNLFPDLILEMGLTVVYSNVINAMLENPERDDKVTKPKVVNSSIQLVILYSDDNHILKEALLCNLKNRASSDVKSEVSLINIRTDSGSFTTQVLDSLNSLVIPITKSIFFLVLGSFIKPIELANTISQCQQKSMFHVYGIHVNRMMEKDFTYFKNNYTNLNFSITGFVEKCGVSSKYTSPVLLYILHLSLGENGNVIKDNISSSWSLEDVYKEAVYVLPGLCERSNLTLISNKNILHSNSNCDSDTDSPGKGNIKLKEEKSHGNRNCDGNVNCIEKGKIPLTLQLVPYSNRTGGSNINSPDTREIQLKLMYVPHCNRNYDGNINSLKTREFPPALQLLVPDCNGNCDGNIIHFDKGDIPPKLMTIPHNNRNCDSSINGFDKGGIPPKLIPIPHSNRNSGANTNYLGKGELLAKSRLVLQSNRNCGGNRNPLDKGGIPQKSRSVPQSNRNCGSNINSLELGEIPPKLRSPHSKRNCDDNLSCLGSGEILSKVRKIFYVSDHCDKEIKPYKPPNVTDMCKSSRLSLDKSNTDKLHKNVVRNIGVFSPSNVVSPKSKHFNPTNELRSPDVKGKQNIHIGACASSSSNLGICSYDNNDIMITGEKRPNSIFDIFNTDLKDVPLMANVDEVLVYHYKLDLDVNFEEKCIDGNIILFIRPTNEEVISKDFQMCLDCTLIDIECVQEISLPEDFEIHFHMKSCCCVKNSPSIDKPQYADLSNNFLCKSCSLLQNYKKHLSTDLKYQTLEYSVYGWCIRIWKDSKVWPKCVYIKYRTKPVGPSLMWCHDDEGNPCTFTPGAYINNRSMMPCQEPPVALSTWQASISVPEGFIVLSSGDKVDCKQSLLQDGVTKKFFFEMSMPLPSSTLAFAFGKFVCSSRVIPVLCSPNQNIVTVSLYASPAKIESFESEYLELSAKYLKSACAILGEYPFTRIDLIIMPRSFACLGLQSPNLTFLSQSVLCGDQSMSTRIAHEISHAWFGLLVGTEDWTEEWLSEGFATYIEDRILAHGQGMNSFQFLNYSYLMQIIRFKTLKAEIEVTVDDNLKRLRPKKNKNHKTAVEAVNDSILDKECESPQAYNMVPNAAVSSKKWSQVHYLKGYFLLLHMAKLVGFESFDMFLKHYISTYAGKLVTSEIFFNLYLAYYSLPTKIKEEIVNQWMESTTLPMSPIENSINNMLVSVVEMETKYWISNNSSNKRCKAAGKKRRRDMFKTRPSLDSNQLVLLLENLLSVQELLPQTLTQMNRVYQFETKNSEVRHRWCELIIKHLYYLRYDQVKRFLIEDQGMGIYLFGEMVITCNSRQLSLAKEVFELIKSEMDRSTYTTVSEILYGVDEANT